MNNKQEILENSINSIAKQIEILSNRCQLEENRKKENYNFQKVLEASSIMLQLSKTLGELILINKALEQEDQGKMLDFLVNGRI